MAQAKFNYGADSWNATSVTLRRLMLSTSYRPLRRRKQSLWNRPLLQICSMRSEHVYPKDMQLYDLPLSNMLFQKDYSIKHQMQCEKLHNASSHNQSSLPLFAVRHSRCFLWLLHLCFAGLCSSPRRSDGSFCLHGTPPLATNLVLWPYISWSIICSAVFRFSCIIY